jgi:hypothetical protein
VEAWDHHEGHEETRRKAIGLAGTKDEEEKKEEEKRGWGLVGRGTRQ